MKLNDKAICKARGHIASVRGLLQFGSFGVAEVEKLSAETRLAFLDQFINEVESRLLRRSREEESE